MEKLEIGIDGVIKTTTYNGTILTCNDPRLRGAFAYNELTEDITLTRPINPMMSELPRIPLVDRVNGDRIQDEHVNYVRTVFDAPPHPKSMGYGLKMSKQDVGISLYHAAIQHRFHPVRRYLEGCEWDGVCRVDELFVKYLDAEDNAYTREIARLLLVAAVTRVYEPGHKFDTAVILESRQGTRKSTMIKVLARDRWFTELDTDIGDRKKTVEQMQGFWFIELPELKSFSMKDANEIKQFISGTVDTVRMAYAHNASKFRRQCVFVGSTNDSRYLPDQTGNRRFWPVRVNVDVIDTEGLDSEMDQIWAEALYLYREMRETQPHGTLPLFLSEGAEKIAQVEQGLRTKDTVESVQSGHISFMLDAPVPISQLVEDQVMDNLDDPGVLVRRNYISVRSLWTDIQGRDASSLTPQNVQQMSRILDSLEEWECIGRKMFQGRREMLYVRRGFDIRKEPYVVVNRGVDDDEEMSF